MKATITFDLTNEEDKEKFQEFAADKNGALRAAMWKFAQETLRKYRKYGGLDSSVRNYIVADQDGMAPADIGQAVVELIEKEFYAAIEEYKATLD